MSPTCGGDCCRPKMPSGQEVSDHIGRRWPVPHLDQELLGVVLAATKLAEEAGEVAGAAVKLTEGRSNKAQLVAELGDVMVAASCLAGRLGVDLQEVAAQRWAEVVQR